MRLLFYGVLVAVGLGAVVAPIVAGLLGAAGVASSPVVQAWLFAVPETLLGMADIEKPTLFGLVVGWTIEFIPLGVIIVALSQIRFRRNATDRAAAFEQAVTTFHDSEYEAEYE